MAVEFFVVVIESPPNEVVVLERYPRIRLIVIGGAASLEVEPGLVWQDSPELIHAALDQLGLPREFEAAMHGHRDALNLLRTSNRLWTYFSPAVEQSRASAPADTGSAATNRSWMPAGAAVSPPRMRPWP
jgi:hypothetical protein